METAPFPQWDSCGNGGFFDNCTDLSVQKDLSRMIAFFLSYSNSLIKHAQVVRELEKELGNTSKRV